MTGEPAEGGGSIPTGPNRPTVGLLIDRIEDSYQNELLLRLADAAQSRNTNLLVFAGGPLEQDWKHPGAHNQIYDLADADTVDGLIVSGGTLEKQVGSQGLAAFLRRFRGLPVCSIGVALPEIPSILVDNGAGIREAVIHLIDDHARRRIAFIRGPEANEEAAQRFRGYLKALLDRRIPPDHQLIVDGDFSEESGANAVGVLLDDREAEFHALVAANDHMALGAAQELERRGYAVPGRVAIVGFDDVVDGQYAAYPLTTVRQPIARQAAQALDVVLSMMQGTLAPSAVMLETELVTRRSCGCPIQRSAYEVAQPRRPRKGDQESPLLGKREEIVRELVTVAPEIAGRQWAEALFEAFVSDLRRKAQIPFAVVIDSLCLQLISAGGEVRTLQRVITALRRTAVPALVELPTLLLRAESMLHEARVLIANMLQHREVRRRLDAERHFHAMCEFAQRLIAALETESVVDALLRAFPELSVPAALLAMHPVGSEHPRNLMGAGLRLVLAYDDRGRTQRKHVGPPASAQSWLRTELLATPDPYVRVVLPLYFRERSLGILLLGRGPAQGAVYETLRAQTSAALEGILLVEELAVGVADRRLLLQRVARHAQELQTAYRALAAELQPARGAADPAVETARDAAAGPRESAGSDPVAGAMQSALNKLDALMAELARFLGSEMDTLRPESDS